MSALPMSMPGALRWIGIAAALVVAVLATGCAHPISLTPPIDKITGAGKGKIDRKVGLAMSDADRGREVTTPGGGGDKVSYFPYRDLESGLYVALSESFAQVSRVSGAADPKVKAEGLHYLVTPTIATTSYSPSLLTWPPTVFTVELSCRISDAEGKAVTDLRVMGEGRAEFEMFKSDPSLAARLASQDALRKLIDAIAAAAPQLR